jgi:hypothetical protein
VEMETAAAELVEAMETGKVGLKARLPTCA